ncbi:nicotinate (nicotinamide) nucleotide adenylyltransferase [bacterium]|jgi:nicotinate-nucleotide adenylyltransferase|nr:nicotinate (nicotinamide) nucleotide adenylyltransferase [bacterium]
MKVGLYGGSFDPVHLGHLLIAEAAKECLGLEEIRWIPAAQSPLKVERPRATNEQRLTMLRLALDGTKGHHIDDRELLRGERSYTLTTVDQIVNENPDDEFYLIIGADSLASMGQWHKPSDLLNLVTLAVVARGGENAPDYGVLRGIVSDDRVQLFKNSQVAMPQIELSSSEIRDRIKDGRSIRFRLPRAVEAFMRSEKLYLGEEA